jgi:hypothetical protein
MHALDASGADADSAAGAARPDAAEIAYARAKHHVLELGPDCDSAGKQAGYGPDALCIGAQKAATTWLYQNLVFHPLAWLPPIKELNFFTSVHVLGHREDDARHRTEQIRESRIWWQHAVGRDEDRRQRLALLDHLADERLTDDWYTGIFDFRGPDQVGIDISPEYCLLPREGVRHAVSINPKVRIIALVRDPVERALSHAAMLAGADADEAAIWQILRSEAIGVLMRYSDYARWLGRWRGLTPLGSMFVATMRQIRNEPHGMLRRLCTFLGLPFHTDLFPQAVEPVFKRRSRRVTTPEMRSFLRERMVRIYDELAEQWPELAADFAADASGDANLAEQVAKNHV